MSANSGPGYKTKPEHRLSTKPAGVRVQVKLGGETVADSTAALRMDEGSYPPVYYFPRQDVRMERLERSSHETYCPFKGTASYYSLKGGAQNAVWSYEKPYDEMLAIKELVAFYPDKVEISHETN
ncbi:MAG: DUF427 domain-containing protein [Betaproteobacteria bacterium]